MSDLLARAWEPIGKKILERLEYCIDFKKNSFSSAKSFSHKAWIPNSHFDDLIESQWQAVEPQCREYIAKAYDRGWNEEGRHPFAEGKAGRIAVIDSFEKEHVVDVLMLMVREVWEQSCDKAVLPRIKGTVQLLRDLDALSKRVKAKKADLSEADKKLMALAAELEQAEMERAIRAAVLDNAKDELIKQMQDYARQNPATMGITNEATAKSHHFGFLDWAKANGVGYYQVNAVLDGKTCKSCAAINGKKFKVEDALKFKEKYLDCLGDKEALKSLTPYIKPSELNKVKGLTDAEIIADVKAHPHPKPTPTPSSASTPPSPPTVAPAQQAPPKPAPKPVEKPKQKIADLSKEELSAIESEETKFFEMAKSQQWRKSNAEFSKIVDEYEKKCKIIAGGKEVSTAIMSSENNILVPFLEEEIDTDVFIEKYKNAKLSDFTKVGVSAGVEAGKKFDDYTFFATELDSSSSITSWDIKNAYYKEAYGRQSLTFGQYAAIDYYKRNFHINLNKWVLGELIPGYINIEHGRYIDMALTGIETAMNDKRLLTTFNVPAPINVVTHRGMDCSPRFLDRALTSAKGDPQKLVGEVLQSDTFMSSSLNKSTATDFGTAFSIEIFIPKGTKGARYLDCCGASNSTEYEYLLKRGAHFKVLEVNNGNASEKGLHSVKLLLIE